MNRFITPELVLSAYEQGLFPMANEHGEIGFYMYEPRGIVPLDESFTIRRSLRQKLKKKEYRVTFDTAPLEVLRACSRAGLVAPVKMWLSEELIQHYFRLFEIGRMHSVEVWKESTLVGGLYGLSFGAVFCGESMFSHENYASQIALVHLVDRLRTNGFQILDAQMPSDHLRQFGLYEMSQKDYLDRFRVAAGAHVNF